MNRKIDFTKLKPFPWRFLREDGSLLSLGTVGKENIEGHVLSCIRCKSCQKEERMLCLWPNKNHADFIEEACNNYQQLNKKINEQELRINNLKNILIRTEQTLLFASSALDDNYLNRDENGAEISNRLLLNYYEINNVLVSNGYKSIIDFNKVS